MDYELTVEGVADLFASFEIEDFGFNQVALMPVGPAASPEPRPWHSDLAHGAKAGDNPFNEMTSLLSDANEVARTGSIVAWVKSPFCETDNPYDQVEKWEEINRNTSWFMENVEPEKDRAILLFDFLSDHYDEIADAMPRAIERRNRMEEIRALGDIPVREASKQSPEHAEKLSREQAATPNHAAAKTRRVQNGR